MTVQQGKRFTARVDRNSAPAVISALPGWLPYVLFALTTVLFFHSQLLGDTYFWEDFIEYVYPVQTFAANHLAQGTLPFWNPFTFNGMPFLADAQVGFFYPGNMLLALFASDGHLPVAALQFVVILHFFIAQAGMYVLGRHWGISSAGALVTAVSYAFSGMAVCHVFHPMMLYHLAWLPFILLHFDKGLSLSRLKHSLFSGLLFGMVMLAGHPQTTLYIALLLLLCTVWHVGHAVVSRTASARSLLMTAVLAAVPIAIAAGLFMVQYLPSSELASLSERNEFTYEKATEGSLRVSQYLTAVVPHLYGHSSPADQEFPFYLEGAQYYYYWETAFYFGIPAIILGIVGALAVFRTRTGGFLLFAAVVGGLFALGSNGFLYDLFYQFPLFGSFRLPGRMLFYVIIAGTVLAGFGFDAIAQRTRSVSLKTIGIAAGIPLLVSLGVLAGVLTAIAGTPEQLAAAVRSAGLVALLFTAIAAVLVFLLYRGALNARVGGILLAVLAFAELYTVGADFNRGTRNPDELYSLSPALKQMMTPSNSDSLFRTKMREGGYMAMARNQGMTDRVMLYEGYNPLLLARRVPPAPSLAASLDLLNMRYDIALDRNAGTAGFVERTTWFPRARMVYRAVTTTPEQAASVMRSGGIEFTTTALLEKASPVSLSNKTPGEVQHSVRSRLYSDNAIEYEVSTAENGILALSEIWYPAWQVFVDGKPSELLRINYSLRGVALPAGRHTVRMEYHSASFASGSTISLATLLLTVGALVLLQLREKKRPSAIDA